MSKSFWTFCMGLFGLTLIFAALPAGAQSQEVKSKPPMYSYVANWQVAREHWSDMDSVLGPVNDVLQKELDNGTIVGYGNDINLVHQTDSETHDTWWSAMSFAGLIKALEQARAAADPHSQALNGAKHWDDVLVSHYYNWKSGPYKGAYTHVAMYKLKPDAPDDALENLSEHFMVPTLEKLLADGTILEYEIDTMAIHTTSPGLFFVVYLTPTPEGIDTAQAAVRDTVKAHPLAVQAFSSETDDSAHRDELAKSSGVYK